MVWHYNKLVLLSACLCGVNCRYDGRNSLNEQVVLLIEKGLFVPVIVCPEQLAGFPTPRPRIECVGGGVKFVDENNKDVTSSMVKGANEVLKIVDLLGIRYAILKDKSPSCGVNFIYDGSFSGRLIRGCGIVTAFLTQRGLKVYSDCTIKEFERDFQI